MTAKSHFVEVNGLGVHYLTWGGQPEGSPYSGDRNGRVVLCHATGFMAALWEPVADRLAAAGYEVIAPDARGHGDSEKPEPHLENYDWAKIAGDLRAFLDVMGLRGVPVFGHSMGGGCALYVAGEHPEYFSRIAAFEPIVMPGGFHPDETQRDRMAAGARKRRTVFASVDEMVAQYRQRPTFADWPEETLRLYAEEGTFVREDGHRELKCSGHIEAAVFGNSGSLDIWTGLAKIEVPVMVMRGEKTTEPFMRMVAESVAERLPNGRLVVSAGVGHLAPMERPEVVAEEVLAFLSEA